MPGPEWIWVVVVIAVIFGASRLPSMGRNVGLGIKEFKKGIADASKNDDDEKSEAHKTAGPTGTEERGPSA
jgi:sec-independent protein translocase protein TatA